MVKSLLTSNQLSLTAVGSNPASYFGFPQREEGIQLAYATFVVLIRRQFMHRGVHEVFSTSKAGNLLYNLYSVGAA